MPVPARYFVSCCRRFPGRRCLGVVCRARPSCWRCNVLLSSPARHAQVAGLNRLHARLASPHPGVGPQGTLAVLKDPRTRRACCCFAGHPVPDIRVCGDLDLNNVPYAVLDRRSASSGDLLAKLDGSGVFHRVANLDRRPDMRRNRRAAWYWSCRSPGLRAAAGIGRARRGASDRRRPELKHGRPRWAMSVSSSGLQCRLAGGHGEAGPAISVDARPGTIRTSRRGGSSSQPDCHAHADSGLLLTAMSVVREREDGTLRSAAGDTIPPRRS